MINCEECTRACKYHHDKWKDGECKYYASQVAFNDHIALLSWWNYVAHRTHVPCEITNFDEREKIVLPSGKVVRIIAKIEYLGEFGVDYHDFG